MEKVIAQIVFPPLTQSSAAPMKRVPRGTVMGYLNIGEQSHYIFGIPCTTLGSGEENIVVRLALNTSKAEINSINESLSKSDCIEIYYLDHAMVIETEVPQFRDVKQPGFHTLEIRKDQ